MRKNGGAAVRQAKRSFRSEASEAQALERKQACAHALLNRPWVSKDKDPELYFAIKDHYEELREWFMDIAGFPLLMTRSLAKLDRTPVVPHAWMGFEEFREVRDYVFFTYALWYLEGKTELDQFLLSHIVEEVKEQMAMSGLEADWRIYHHRLSMTRALKKLSALGVLILVDGDESDWAASESKNALYECSPHSRYVLRRFPQDLNSYREMGALTDPVAYVDTEDGVNARKRHRVFRRFLLEPAVLDKEWDAELLPYVLKQRRYIMDHMERMLGMEARRYREGLLFFHPQLTSEAELFPTLSGVSDLVLLLAGELRRQLHQESHSRYKEDNGAVRLERSELEGLLLRLQERHGAYWSKELRESSSSQLAELCMAHMEEWSLGEREDSNHFLVLPVLARWNAEYGHSDFD
ncbi:TIGR02678 family protein [Cohnella fermenti]|uniref:TIGR02678 family protein n=1 Tax=Cohnella fermenti TaxID=2565925 RepID=A0A4S4BIZ6_9BACL|nr:TIGR02678 family protein [Cohnella fermenti]THF73608.1 TIGR02678 family protein [Cohnella fermenti]